MKFLLKTMLVLAALGGGVAIGMPYLQAYWKARNKPNYRLAEVARGEIVLVVNSTGAVQPIRRVQVGSFVSGPIDKLFVDFNSEVKENDLLVKIDPKIYNANVARDRASCATATAEVARIEALLQQARNDEKRAQDLEAENEDYVSDAEMDRVKYTRISWEAQLALAQAQVEQAKGNLTNSEANLEYTNIRSPVSGVVIDRKVDQGQTVAAQFQTPELFVVAPEMDKRMYVFASVDEADVGLIREAKQREQEAFFTVDAYPDDLFKATIYQVRVNPISTQNVVTYTVLVEAPNRERKLLPGMTAKLSFQIEKHQNVLKVPNAALRFYPKPEQVRPDDRPLLEGTEEDDASSEEAKLADTQRSAMDRAQARKDRHRRHVWVVEDDFLRAVEVTIGLADSKYTEVASGQIEEGQELVTGIKPKTP